MTKILGDTYDEYVEGWTAPIEYTLKHKDPQTGEISTFDASGMTPGLILKDKDGNAVSTTGKVEWADAPSSKIRYNPAATDFVAANSPYYFHWKVTDGAGKDAYYPQGTRIQVKIHAQ